ncbi:hypothetical protein DTO166G4_5326 [Paecilomyces variotii]|uniref:RNA ligase/cyclic nucleotide phosphodiesterase n=1 Tax=Byssochlamys spectabilis TaxID=264951 RepID=A0A443HWU0_BYSSP|nr:RNA ligase/cyclic nucleotide phosphodiesterase [Paecilomyces variotii]KAJ9212996.1 hypothetical protein DTO166G4_5326 [Paecilomyces variotii]KAJ9234241.1 hypothetical protein DTO166G5_5302 [Paecilomyces variotii]KAJ9308584.1 hypothetical protein DTO217A2_1826 [Paecilomyces variotii]KAJ9362598.1 hypothetical protein DTO027B9_275 [Paecilomyces variotii]KAJ9363843.1 hypothetical protein DTO280E4_2065 [Paecilomyces variotii]
MTETQQQRTLFSFPAIPPGPPSRRNWYQELLDDPECQNDPKKVQEAYESHRHAILSRSIGEFRSLARSISEDIPTLITPDVALIQHVSRQMAGSKAHEPFPLSPANCLVFWARPPHFILELMESIQSGLSSLAGRDLYLVPLPHMHLSVMELSHRHPIAHLRAVYNVVGESLLHTMADVPFTKYKESQGRSVARLIKPQLMMDRAGVAVTFVPDYSPQEGMDNSGQDITKNNPFTYHHLRASMQELALSSGIEIDTSYTAPSAHITIARFVSSHFFDGGEKHATSPPVPISPPTEQSPLSPSGNQNQRRVQKAEQWVDLIHGINEELGKQSEDPVFKEQLEWVVGQQRGLELQLGYVKFGRETERAEMVGQAVPLA